MSETVQLAEVAQINPKGPARGALHADEVCDFVPMAGVHEDGTMEVLEKRPYHKVAKGYTSFRSGDVLLAKITPCFENGKISLARTSTEYAFGSTEFHVIRPMNGDLDSRYLYYFLRQGRIRADGENQMTGSAGQKRVPRSFLDQLKIPLPDIEEQRRIAAILDKADGIRRKREQALNMTDRLLQSAFLEMFGDPVSNPKGWPVVKLGDCAEEVRYGTSVKCTDDSSDGLPVLRIPNVVGGEVIWDDLKFASLSKNEIDKLRMRSGDIIFVRTNGNPEYIARCAVFDAEEEALFASYLIRARLSAHSKLTPRYVWMALSMPSYRRVLLRETKTTAGNYNISGSGLKSLKISAPPLSHQRAFERLYRRLSIGIANMAGGLADAENLLGSLSQRAFRGEL